MFGFFHRMQFYKSRATLLSVEAQTRPRIGLLFHSILHQSVSCLAPPLAHLLLWSWVSLISKYVHSNNTAAEAVLVEGRRSAAYLPGKKQCLEVSVAVEFVKAPSLVFSRVRSCQKKECSILKLPGTLWVWSVMFWQIWRVFWRARASWKGWLRVANSQFGSIFIFNQPYSCFASWSLPTKMG